ncbi:hypothetical protein [uncultured Cellulomonas sp.]|uniref:hypothetical protein n=1 Tax=uncultured Cellulomonas sp. TaxID=189682 RepID=UPI0028ECB8A7|nr:hypothetical protein [uncultured Cellulomonas sp.]
MRAIDFVDLLSEVLPRRWIRGALLVVVVGVVVTGNGAPFVWYVTEKAAAIQEDFIQPMLDRMMTDLLVGSTTPAVP